jgi:hypothetical protein
VPQEAAPTWKTWVASPKSMVTARNGARSAGVETPPGRLDEEVQQHRVAAGGHDQQVAARGQPGEQRLRDARRQHRGDGGVDGVAPARSTAAPASAVAG